MKRRQIQPTRAQLAQWLRTHKIAGGVGSDFTALQAAITALTAQAAQNTSLEGSASGIITGFAAQITQAVIDALAADDAADQGSIAAATAAIAGVTSQFVASAAPLGAAIATNTPPPPPPPPPPPGA